MSSYDYHKRASISVGEVNDLKADLAGAKARIAELEAERDRLRETGDAMKRRLLSFVGAVGDIVPCGGDVDAVTAWERASALSAGAAKDGGA